jgi:hypothetical protein
MLRYPPTRITLDANELESALRALARRANNQYDARARLRIQYRGDEFGDPCPSPNSTPDTKHKKPKLPDPSTENLVQQVHSPPLLSVPTTREIDEHADPAVNQIVLRLAVTLTIHDS